ncbi:MAG TPA: hypothetical protein VLK58_11190 [Conexibacter sp.]|nr:hypothetical protein [Conexibacter sp.]
MPSSFRVIGGSGGIFSRRLAVDGGQRRSVAEARGDDARHRRTVGGRLVAATAKRVAEDLRPPRAHLFGNADGRLGDDESGSGRQRHDGVGKRFDEQDEIWIEVELFGVVAESVQDDHVRAPPWMCGAAGMAALARRSLVRRASVLPAAAISASG